MAPKDKLLRESIKIGERSSRKSKGLPDRTQNTDCVNKPSETVEYKTVALNISSEHHN